MERITFLNQRDCIRLSNDTIDTVIATTIGPRILRCGVLDGPNLLGEYPDLATRTALGDWKPWGGHRLWAAPELMPGSYAPDDQPVRWELVHERRLTIRQPTDATSIEKVMTIQLAATGGRLTVEHEIWNRHAWPVE